MPELPEVETVRRGLAPVMEGARIARVALHRPDLRYPFPAGFAERMAERKILALSRRAKYMLADLEGGEVLVSHLGMSGSFRIEKNGEARTPGEFQHQRSGARAHDHVEFHLADSCNSKVIYNDPRRFGFMLLMPRRELEAHPRFATLGVEPDGNALSPDVLARLFAGKAAPLKAALLDQKLIAGLGNIYVCEALWQARLSPTRPAGAIVRANGAPSPACSRLAEAIRDVIARAIAAGGSTLRDHRQTDGSLGYFQHAFAVYDREGQPCARTDCAGRVRRIVQSGRSTFLCPRCQR